MLQRARRPLRTAAFGFTVIELIIVMAVFFVLAVTVAPTFVPTLASRDLETSAALATDALRQAQGNVMTGRDYKRWGVHFQADRFVLFSGATYNAGATDNVVKVLTDRIRISTVTLSGGSCTVATGVGNCDVHFAQTEGTPTEAGTITLVNSGNTSETKTVTVGVAGMTDFQ
jgi:type II secretory pathway pseudopilin PulG